MKGKVKHILKAVASGLIWGLGQVFNKQYIKALFFFLFFAIFVTIEVGSSKYITDFDPYSKLTGDDLSETLVTRFYSEYKVDVADRKIQPIEDFDTFYEEHKEDKFTVDELIEFTAKDIYDASPKKYYILANELKASDSQKGIERDTDLYPGEDDEIIDTLQIYIPNFTTYQDETGAEYQRVNIGTSKEPSYVFVNIDDENDVKTAEEIKGFNQLDREGNIYTNNDYSKFYIEVINVIDMNSKEVLRYDNIIDRSDSILNSNFLIKLDKIRDAIYHDGTNVYGYYNPEAKNGQYRQTEFSKYLGDYFVSSNLLYVGNNQDDFAKFKLRVYFEMFPELKASFEETYNNFYYDKAGFFLKGLWSVVSLGTAEKVDYYQINNLSEAIDVSNLPGTVITNIYVRGHLSSYLLIRGLISTLLLFFFLGFCFWGVLDAYKTSIEYEKTKVKVNDKEYFKGMYEKAFEYIVLSPAIFVITFISVMPIIFGFLIAFTSYNGQAADIGLFDWVGFKNFLEIFSFGKEVGLPFAETFWRVFLWTVIWAIFSTFTVFFGGFFQAVIISSERVPLKKFWRTLLILPWAIPAIISQMVFANFFNEVGVVNDFLSKVGVYNILQGWGWLGKTWDAFKASDLPSIVYLGSDNIQWFTNPHNQWFVRTALITVNIWLGFPFYMALMTSVMTGLDKSLYEAADIDGASKSQKFRFITFPLVLYSTAPLLVMCFSGNFNNFGMIYFTTQGGANKGYTTAFAGDTDILISWMYTLTVEEKYYNMASVFSILIFIVVGSITAWNYSRTRSFKED